MKETPTLKSKLSIDNLVTEVLFILALGGLILYINYHLFKGNNGDMLNIVSTILIAALMLYRIVLVLKMDSITLYQNRLERRSILGYSKSPIHFSNITCWVEHIYNMPATGRLSLFTQNNRYIISSACYKNYNEMKEYIAANTFHNLEKETAIYNRLYNRDTAIILLLASIGLGLASTTFFQTPRIPFQKDPAVWIGLGWFVLFTTLAYISYLKNPCRRK